MKKNYLLFFSLVVFKSSSAFAYSGQDEDSTLAAHRKIEEVYLAKARQNIENYRKGNATLSFLNNKGKPIKNVRVTVNQTSQDFLFGNLCEEAFSADLTPGEAEKFKSRFKSLFNFTELIVKWTRYEPTQGKPEWKRFQEHVDWCIQNHITPKGHTLGWTNMSGTPPWLLKLPTNISDQLYQARIYNLVGGFKNQIGMWDVVNEAMTTIPWEKAMLDTAFGASKINEGDRYNTKGIKMEEIIPWVEKSYRFAYQANPKGDFILNDFYQIAKPEIREKFYQLVKELLQRKVPVTGIGIQAHEPHEMWFSPVEIIKTFDKYRKFGLPVHITEFIPQSSGKAITGGWRNGIWTEDAQAECAEQFYTLAFGDPSVVSIHWWGLSDKIIWLKGGGLLDSEMNPKPVYNHLLKLIRHDWMTLNAKGTTDRLGQVNLRGFAGDYDVEATYPSGMQRHFKLHIGQGKNESVLLR